MIYSVRHITSFSYEPAIRESVMEVRVQPRTEAQQRCLTFSLDIAPNANVMVYRDFLGNIVHHFDIPGRHNELKVTALALVQVDAPLTPSFEDVGTWNELDEAIAKADFWEMLLPSHFAHPTELLLDLAKELKLERAGNPFEVLSKLNHDLYTTFRYVPNSTSVDSPIDDALRTREGVCQDLSHIMLALVRNLGVPCRYVSGYVCHRDDTRDRSADGATHAWMEAFLPGPGWVAFDPTNDFIGSERHIRVAIGRDYADVPPTRGVYKGEAESELSVAVSVVPSEAPLPEELPPATVIRSKPVYIGALDPFQQDQQQQQQQ